MNNDDFKKSIIQSEYPWTKLEDWCFYLLDKAMSREEISKLLKPIQKKKNTVLPQVKL